MVKPGLFILPRNVNAFRRWKQALLSPELKRRLGNGVRASCLPREPKTWAEP